MVASGGVVGKERGGRGAVGGDGAGEGAVGTGRVAAEGAAGGVDGVGGRPEAGVAGEVVVGVADAAAPVGDVDGVVVIWRVESDGCSDNKFLLGHFDFQRVLLAG